MKRRNLSYAIIFILACLACKKESSNPVYVDQPVIQAYLKVGDTARLNVSRLVAYSSDAQYSSDNLDALQIFISNGANSYQLQPKGDGNYIASNPVLKITSGSTYSLNLTYNGKNVTATTVIPPKPTNYSLSVSSISIQQITATTTFSGTQPDPVTLTWTNSDGSYYLVVVQNIQVNPVLINTTRTDVPSLIFGASPQQTNTYQIRPRRFAYFGLHRVILYHLNPDYANFYGNNNNNSNTLANITSAITNGAGIFTGLNADTLLLNVIRQ